MALQWGHGDEAPVHDLGQLGDSGFDGATAMKPWKRERRLAICRRSMGFNGATAMKPWKSAGASG